MQCLTDAARLHSYLDSVDTLEVSVVSCLCKNRERFKPLPISQGAICWYQATRPTGQTARLTFHFKLGRSGDFEQKPRFSVELNLSSLHWGGRSRLAKVLLANEQAVSFRYRDQ